MVEELNIWGTSFLRKWILNTFYGWLLGWTGVFILIVPALKVFSIVGIAVDDHPGQWFCIGAFIGSAVSFCQVNILKKLVGGSMIWVLVSAVGLGISHALFYWAFSLWSEIPNYATEFSFAFGGLFVGVFQYFILKKRTSRAKSWIWISFSGWMMVGVIFRLMASIDFILFLAPINGFLNILLFLFGTSGALGAATGIGLRWVFNVG